MAYPQKRFNNRLKFLWSLTRQTPIRHFFEENHEKKWSREHLLPHSLYCGRRKINCKNFAWKIVKKQNSSTSFTKFNGVGLLISEKYRALVCKVDRIADCICKITFKLNEIRCTYSLRENHLKNVALQKSVFWITWTIRGK